VPDIMPEMVERYAWERLAERIYAGNVAWWNYECHMDLHVVKWHEGLEE